MKVLCLHCLHTKDKDEMDNTYCCRECIKSPHVAKVMTALRQVGAIIIEKREVEK